MWQAAAPPRAYQVQVDIAQLAYYQLCYHKDHNYPLTQANEVLVSKEFNGAEFFPPAQITHLLNCDVVVGHKNSEQVVTQPETAPLFSLSRIWEGLFCSRSEAFNHGAIANFQQLTSQLYGLNVYDTPHMIAHLMMLYFGKTVKELFTNKFSDHPLKLKDLRNVLTTGDANFIAFKEIYNDNSLSKGIAIVIALLQAIGIDCYKLKTDFKIEQAEDVTIINLTPLMAAGLALTKDGCFVIEFTRGTSADHNKASFHNYVVLKIAKHLRTELFSFCIASPNR